MIRKTNISFLRFLALAVAIIPLLFACSGSQQQGDELQVSEDSENSQEDFGNDDAGEGNGQENVVDDQEELDNYEANSSEEGADMNNDTLNDTQEEDLVNEEEMMAEDSGEASGEDTLAEEVPMEEVPMEEAPMQEVMADEGMAAPAPSGPTAPMAGGRVRYVTEGGAQVTSGPGGSPVYSLNQGDHPVTWEESGQYKVSEGMYIAPQQMSDAPVGRAHYPATWQ